MHTPHAHIQHSITQQQRKWRNIFWVVMALLILFQALDLWASEAPVDCQPSKVSRDSPSPWQTLRDEAPELFSF